jgi:hypothetical protein
MGCGASSVPDVIIPDPTPNQKCKVLFKKQGMFARDQNIFQDCDKSKKWLFMDKEGGLWDDKCSFVLENFVREKGSNQGQVLCAAQLKVAKAKTYGFEVHEDSDSSSEDSGDGENVEVEQVKMKWAQVVKVEFFKDREMKEEIAKVKVKAKGKAIRTKITTETEEGGVQISYEVTKKVKKVKYTIEELKGCDGELPKIALKGKPNGSAYHLEWESPMFQAEIDSNGWGSQEIVVQTDAENPALGLLMGYIIAKEISPDDIKDNVNVPFV